MSRGPNRREALQLLAGAGACLAGPARALEGGYRFREAPMLTERMARGELPEVDKRLPKTPLFSNFASRGRTLGHYGGDIRTIAAKARDLRYVSANSYTRLVGYDEHLRLQPDILQSVEVKDGRAFTFTLREGHRWSTGDPFTTEDFRYYWEDVANNKELSPSGPPEIYLVDGKPPKVEILDSRRIRYTWGEPNPRFLPALAQPRPLPAFSPSAYLKTFHRKYRDKAELDALAAKAKMKSWAALHNRMDDAYENSNPDMPTLNPWRVLNGAPATRFVFERNPYFHRVDPAGRQLPYVDRIVIEIAAPGLFAAKANAGEVDYLARGLTMNDAPILKEGEAAQGYRTLLWPNARGSAYALYPNLNTTDPAWRALNRDIRWRKALSAAIDRRILNNALLFGLGSEGNNTVAPQSPLYDDADRTANAAYDPDLADRLLDEIGLTTRDSSGIRLLPDGRVLEIVVEVDGEASDTVDALQLIGEMWRDVGVKLFVKPQDRSILRQRSFAGQTVMVASTGLDNAIPTAAMPPTELAPVRQEHYSWPKWGQFFETHGKNGETPDIPEAKRLLELYGLWLTSDGEEDQARIWADMLRNHAENQWTIGTVSGELQPIVISGRLRNVPKEGVFSWEPTSLMGIYRIDEFWYEGVA